MAGATGAAVAAGPASDETLRLELAADVFPAIRSVFTLGGLGVVAVAWSALPVDALAFYAAQLAVFAASIVAVWLPASLRLRVWGLTAGLVSTALLAMLGFGPMAGNGLALAGAVMMASVFLGRVATAVVTALSLVAFAAIGTAACVGVVRLHGSSAGIGPETWLRTGVTFSIALVVMAVGFERLLGAMTRLTRASREALRTATGAEASFRQLVEATPELIAIHRAGETLYVNPALRRLVGYPQSGGSTNILDWVHPDDVLELRARARASGPLGVHQHRLLRSDGQYIEAEFIAIDVEYQGAPARVAIGRDVTERNAVLARLTLSDRLASLGTLAAGVAHELNNPLAFVQANLEYISAELQASRRDPSASTAGEKELLAAVEEARTGAERMRLIVRDMRTLSRVDDVPKGPVDPRRALQWAAALAMPLLRDRARLEQDLPAGLELEGSEARLGQVLLNLLVNAAQAIPKGSPALNLVRVTGRRVGGRVVLEVTDSGPGMPEAVRKRAFEPFFTTKGPGEGTGLGLWVCHNLVGVMGGDITLESEPGRGARFSISLKAAAQA